MIFKIILLLIGLSISTQGVASLSVITTTTNVEALVEEIGGKFVKVESLTKGTQDPHFVDAKPSFIMKASRADLLISVGLELEIGWLPSILRGARNQKIMKGQTGSLILGEIAKPLDIPVGAISRDQGDVHPDGNPHFMLDPFRAGELGLAVANKLAELDSENAGYYKKRAKAFQTKLQRLTVIWKRDILASGKKEIFTYHKTLTYFLHRMGVNSIASVEPKPGVPPTASHILSLIKLAKTKQITVILVENFFEKSPALRIQKDVPNIKVRSVPVTVKGAPGINSLELLYEELVKSLTKK